MKDYVFISYSREDQAYMRRLADELRARGFSVWNDSRIDVGDRWWQTIVQAVRESSALIIVMTPAAEASEWVEREVQLALMESKPIFPLLLSGLGFPLLITRQYVEVLNGEMPPEDFYQRLERAVPRALSSVPVGEEDSEMLSNVPVGEEGLETLPPSQPFEPEMVLVPEGEFKMGSDPQTDAAASENEQPQHVLYLPAYYLAKTPLTNDLYLAFVRDVAYPPPSYWQDGKPPLGCERHPVTGLTWHDAVAYCHWLSEVTGKAYGLPCEAQWEKSARGSDGHIYPWGDGWDPQRCNSAESGHWSTTPVDAYPSGASPCGLLDMAGNVWEWTRSLCVDYPCDPIKIQDAVEAQDRRVLRGGSYGYKASYARCAFRLQLGPNNRGRDIGFRVALDLGNVR